jgi:SAM-dependent methyltransferase
MKSGDVERRYQDGTYLVHNPDWDKSDSPWKATLILNILKEFKLSPSSICEVGCGAGDILAHIKRIHPDTKLTGFDISVDAARFWKNHEEQGIRFHCGDFLELDRQRYDCILLLDVIEHLANPFDFLGAIKERAEYFIFHFPLDLSASSVLREKPILKARQSVGHIHYFTKGLVFALLRETGFDVMHWRYTNAYWSGPSRSLRARIASLPRRLAFSINKDFGVRLLGGETLMVLARTAKN